ncbi:MAG: Transcriptional regulatory protein DegU [Rhodocyclaceae bacterium]|nr:MAG: response regulator transcription factor [Rhodocyclaceae bacterium]MBE7424213.1 response regulator transcription factor [Zoogloeaceae bacterium]MBV6407246.1 Transcriptional regulatory protein DegU [Rhodocyclaceae bacterium]MCK6385765.1 response regulator transcription factor [Rhodocyclaceae bacterium]CAG0946479.1 Transcriptional regulatory protein DegU [Gammaproteobacteria bacterium]
MLRLLVIDDHAMVREGLLQILRKLGPNVVQYEAQDAESALLLLETEKDFDLVLLDIMLPGTNGLPLLGILRKRFPAIPVVVLSALDDVDTVNRAMRLGAAGYVTKSGDGETLLEALRRVLAGELYLPAHLQDRLAVGLGGGRGTADRFGLTDGQRRVVELLREGKSNRDIGELLGLTEGTVKVHVSKIFRKLGVVSRAEAIALLQRQRSRI